MAKARGLTFKPAEAGSYVSGTLVGATKLGNGKFAMIDDGLGFSLAPWHSPLEQRVGRQFAGVAMPGGGIDWTFGRTRGLGYEFGALRNSAVARKQGSPFRGSSSR